MFCSPISLFFFFFGVTFFVGFPALLDLLDCLVAGFQWVCSLSKKIFFFKNVILKLTTRILWMRQPQGLFHFVNKDETKYQGFQLCATWYVF